MVTLWRTNQTGLTIQSGMHRIAERIEVGVLEFELAHSAVSRGAHFIDLPSSFASHFKVMKLTICEADVEAESGLVLVAADGKELIVVAGVYPYSLAVSDLPSIPQAFEPEYPLDRYTKVPLGELGSE